MKIQQIRNATLLLTYGGKRFLVDPFLGHKDSYPPFGNSARQDQNNPLVDLPIPVEQLTDGLDAVIITHLHLDHYDAAAKHALPEDLPVFSQNEADAAALKNDGFTNVIVLTEDAAFGDIRLSKTTGQHGRGEVLKRIGLVCGVVFQHKEEKTLYIAGDTVWYEGVQEAIDRYQPEIIVLNAGDNQFTKGGSLIMGTQDVHHTHQAAPNALLIASHMEAVNHWGLSREQLKNFATEQGFADQLRVPQDGETLEF
ncbi:MBL fold metallo-hydrolase [Planococcus sp. ISL-109]|uniref:MBL fold metallo-hydrolase n=1 Tax=Planococcus sp. ISL-109 TaxID=2819166 RepID=UPI001BE809B1|nr:MBL fold metallo-hydrolase [Planococcus sp. ISL-109]MBT2583950.1 MBL fold metallo-hydrolase [Planococcus sp. ISL-109]